MTRGFLVSMLKVSVNPEWEQKRETVRLGAGCLGVCLGLLVALLPQRGWTVRRVGDLVFEEPLCGMIGGIHSLMGKEWPQGRRQRPYFGKIQLEQRTVSLAASASMPGVKVLLMHSVDQ